MSSYFDSFDREVYATSSAFRDAEQFVKELADTEQDMIRDCEFFAGDMETPEDVRRCIMAVIALSAINPTGSMVNERAKEMAMMCRFSKLSRDMHSLFHDIARMRYEMRYGMVFDNPREAVKLRDNFVFENQGKPHPWQANPPTEKKPLALRDAPAFCKKAVELSTL